VQAEAEAEVKVEVKVKDSVYTKYIVMVTRKQVEIAQQQWADGLVQIGLLKETRPAFEAYAHTFLDELYAFELGPVLFKPTKCTVEPFRPTKSRALSYFIAGDICECSEDKDKGFALEPWKKVRFYNAHLILEENRAIAMGHYYFTDNQDTEVRVEYTLGYKRVGNKLKIDLHHSSLPYNPWASDK